MNLAIALRKMSVQDYHRMAETGILLPDERAELLEGQIIRKAAKGTAHSAAARCIEQLLRDRLAVRRRPPSHTR